MPSLPPICDLWYEAKILALKPYSVWMDYRLRVLLSKAYPRSLLQGVHLLSVGEGEPHSHCFCGQCLLLLCPKRLHAGPVPHPVYTL